MVARRSEAAARRPRRPCALSHAHWRGTCPAKCQARGRWVGKPTGSMVHGQAAKRARRSVYVAGKQQDRSCCLPGGRARAAQSTRASAEHSCAAAAAHTSASAARQTAPSCIRTLRERMRKNAKEFLHATITRCTGVVGITRAVSYWDGVRGSIDDCPGRPRRIAGPFVLGVVCSV